MSRKTDAEALVAMMRESDTKAARKALETTLQRLRQAAEDVERYLERFDDLVAGSTATNTKLSEVIGWAAHFVSQLPEGSLQTYALNDARAKLAGYEMLDQFRKEAGE